MAAILLICTANACRSVMAQAMLTARLAERGAEAAVTSAGIAGDGRPPPAAVISVLAARGLDVTGHRSRTVTAGDLATAGLILGLARDHVRHATVVAPQAWPRAFTLAELVWRGRQAGPRAAREPWGDWLTRVADGRDRRDLLGRSPADDVADPTGGPLAGYQATADRVDRLTRELAALGWPG